ncbi:MAG: sigma-70 family RNA polymerase sigma factor [Acidobacteriota bacterium]
MSREDVTTLLHAYCNGDREAFNQLVPLVYQDLRQIARRHLRRTQRGQTLDTTALVHEVYMKMVDQKKVSLKDRAHFLAVSACAMRQVIVTHARARTAAKRGGGKEPVSLDEARIAIDRQAEKLLSLDESLTKLRERNERMAQVVECRFFAGLSEQETAEALDISVRTAQRDWTRARAWLQRDLSAAGPSPGPS